MAFDISQDRVDQLNQKSSPISDPEIEDYLLNKKSKYLIMGSIEETLHLLMILLKELFMF